MKSFYLLFFAFSIIFLISCQKEAGKGGTSNIKGKVYAKYYNKNFSILADSAYAADVDVYIIYNDQYTFGDRQKTSHDGSYEFKYLEKGSYKIYAYTKDSTGAYNNHVNQYAPDFAIIQQVEITKKKQIIEVPLINIVQ